MNINNRKNNSKSGFTLVEVLTVLVIIGIVLAITIPNVSKLMYNENDKKLNALISSALKASNVYIDTYKKKIYTVLELCKQLERRIITILIMHT